MKKAEKRKLSKLTIKSHNNQKKSNNKTDKMKKDGYERE
jgi:hypothetical protein